MRTFSIYMFFLLNISCYAQNLILNGDFEDYINCPNGYSTPSIIPYEITKCNFWNAPTKGTSDYFNTCSLSALTSVPQNGAGWQRPYSGNGYLGCAFASYNYDGSMWWEYIQGTFSRELEKINYIKLHL